MAKNTPPSMEMSFKLNSNKPRDPISSNVLPPSLPHKRPLERSTDLELQKLSHNGIITFEENEDELSRTKRKKCNCKNSKCLKLYCECFANQQLCDGCNCTGCCNTSEHMDTVRKARSSTLDRNPKAFRNKIAYSPSPKAGPGRGEPLAGVHSRGCHCKKSNCLKKYCECFQANILCGDNCKCRECKNFEGSNDRRVVLQSLGKSSPSPPAKKMRPTSVPPTTLMAHPGMGISKPIPSRPPVPSIGAFSPRFDPKTQPRLSELLTAAEEEEKRGYSLTDNRATLNDSAEGLVSFRRPETSRSVSAPIHHQSSQQDPSALQELAGMMSKTVALNRGGLSLAPPRISPTPYNYDLFRNSPATSPSPNLAGGPPLGAISPQSAVRPSFVSSPPPNHPAQNLLPTIDAGPPPQGPGMRLPSPSRPGPAIGGGAFKRVNSNPNVPESGRFS